VRYFLAMARIYRQKLEGVNLVKLLETNSIEDLAQTFGMTYSGMSKRINRQIAYNARHAVANQPTLSERSATTSGAWMNSKERQYFLKHLKPTIKQPWTKF
jgi:hypothetical protein